MRNIMSKKTKITKLRSGSGKSQPQQLSEEDYQPITERIIGLSKKRKSVLFAGSGRGSLPITIPVNVAIQLAEKGKHCLLIDLDLRRDALAQVFEISNEQMNRHLMPKAIKTHFSNLHIWPAWHFIRTRLMNVAEVVDAAIAKMDVVLINAPAFRTSPDRRQILAAADACCVFSKNDAESDEMLRLLKTSECVSIGNIRIVSNPVSRSNNSTISEDIPKATA